MHGRSPLSCSSPNTQQWLASRRVPFASKPSTRKKQTVAITFHHCSDNIIFGLFLYITIGSYSIITHYTLYQETEWSPNTTPYLIECGHTFCVTCLASDFLSFRFILPRKEICLHKLFSEPDHTGCPAIN